MMKYFEGVIEYKYGYSDPEIERQAWLYYKAGNYKIKESTDVMGSKWETIIPFDKTLQYVIHHDEKQIVICHENNEEPDCFTENIEIKHLGNEQILGYDCTIVEIIETNRDEGDFQAWQRHFRQWVANDLLLDSKCRGEDVHYFSHEKLPQYAVVLKYENINEEGKIDDTYLAKDIIINGTEPSIFSLENYPTFEKINEKEYTRRWSLEQERQDQERAKEIQKTREELKRKLGRELTPDENKRPKHYLRSFPFAEAFALALGRPLTEDERENPQRALADLLATLPTEEKDLLSQKLLKHLKFD